MPLCLALFILYAISVLTSSFAVFRLSPAIRNWIERTEATTTSSLLELASLSTEDALRPFHRYFLGAAVIAFCAALFGSRIISDAGRQVLVASAMIFYYAAGSIGAWSGKRAEIVQQFLNDAKKESGRYARYFLASALFVCAVIGAIMFLFGQLAVAHLGWMALFVIVGLVSIVATVAAANSASIVIIFAPAFATIAYLWIAIFVARGALALGKDRLINFLGGYCFLGTAYLALLSLPRLRIWLSVPAICQ
jgi:hypothetical protein